MRNKIPAPRPDFSTASKAEIARYLNSFKQPIKRQVEQILPIKVGVDFSVTENNASLNILDREMSQEAGILIHRAIDFNQMAAKPGDFTLASRFRHRGLGKKLMFAHLESLRDIGLNSCEIVASSSRGAYTWANFGFQSNGGTVRGSSTDTITNRLRLISEYFKIERIEEITSLAGLESTGGIQALAKFKTRLTPLCSTAPLEFRKRIMDRKLDFFAGDTKFFLNSSFNDLIAKYGTIDYDRFPIGEFVMQGLAWRGTFDLNSERQWRTARAATFPEIKAPELFPCHCP